ASPTSGLKKVPSTDSSALLGAAGGGPAATGAAGCAATGVATATFAVVGVAIGCAITGFALGGGVGLASGAGFATGTGAGLATVTAGFGCAGPLPCMRNPHFGQTIWAADCNCAGLKLCVQTGFGQGIVLAMEATPGGIESHFSSLLSMTVVRTQ